MRPAAIAALLALAAPGAALAGSGVFRAAFTETGSASPTGIAAGDLDGDGAVDLVTSNAGSANEIRGFAGDPDGLVLGSVSIPVPSLPSGILLADFDGDQTADLLVALGNDNAVTFLKGLRDQDFFALPSATTPVGSGPIAMAAADLDGDGQRDVVVANEGTDTVAGSISILHGNGDGSFAVIPQDDPVHPGAMRPDLPTELGTRAVVLGNIDGDPALDIIAVNERSQPAQALSVFSGRGGGAFTPRDAIGVASSPRDVALADLDGDGTLDLLVAEPNEDAVTVRLGNGDRTFQAAMSYGVGTFPTRVAVGDLDADGALDIVTSNSRSSDVSVLLGDGNGGFGAVRSYVGDAEPQALVLADLDADELLEPIVATQGGIGGANVAVLRNRGDGTLQAVEDIRAGNGPAALAAADVTDDGRPDLLIGGDGDVLLMVAGAGGGFGPPVSLDVAGRNLGLIAADLDADGRPDIAALDTDGDRISVARGTRAGAFGPVALYPVGVDPLGIAAGDFNGDRRTDLAISAAGPPATVSVLLQRAAGGFEAARSTQLAQEQTPTGVAAIDADCDDRADLVVVDQAANEAVVLQSNGDGTFARAQTLSLNDVGPGPIAVAVADFNRDGIDDFAVGNSVVPPNSPSVRVFSGNCSASGFRRTATAKAGELVRALVARDVTGDGLVDLGLINQTANAVRVLVGKGDGTFQGPLSPDAVSRMPVAMTSADFDGDGRYDAVTANSDPSANNVSVLSNCARDPGCDPFRPGPAGRSALRGDGNADGRRSSADFVAVAAEVMDGDGQQVEAIGNGSFGGARVSPGVDANGDGVVTIQDRRAVARRIFSGG